MLQLERWAECLNVLCRNDSVPWLLSCSQVSPLSLVVVMVWTQQDFA